MPSVNREGEKWERISEVNEERKEVRKNKGWREGDSDGGKDGIKEERDIRGRDHNKHVQNEKWNQIYNENGLEI